MKTLRQTKRRHFPAVSQVQIRRIVTNWKAPECRGAPLISLGQCNNMPYRYYKRTKLNNRVLQSGVGR